MIYSSKLDGLMVSDLEVYSQHFIFFVAYEQT
jgi:hypothetical protein